MFPIAPAIQAPDFDPDDTATPYPGRVFSFPSAWLCLTRRQRDVMCRLREANGVQVARALGVVTSTVYYHQRCALKRLRCAS
jgi:DNA-binding CsgD family transcriptional regulator